MNLKVKSSLIIIVTFILGLVLGIILTNFFFRPPTMIDRIAELRSPQGFAERYERIIDPSESQKEKIQHILQLHFVLSLLNQIFHSFFHYSSKSHDLT